MGNFVPYLLQSRSSTSDDECSTSIYSIYTASFAIKEIYSKSEYVHLDFTNLKILATSIMEYMLENYQIDNFEAIANKSWRHKFKSDAIVLLKQEHGLFDFLFVMNALNFSLCIPRYHNQWKVTGLKGYEALKAALTRAVMEKKPIWDPNYYSTISRDDVEYIFRSDNKINKIPLIEERIQILHEIGAVLLKKYQGTFRNCILRCRGDKQKLLFLLFNDFKAFQDKTSYNNFQVCFGMKATSLISDLNFYGQINMDMNSIAFVTYIDYCAPEVFWHTKALHYSPALKNKIQRGELLEYGSKEELEIRCCSIQAIKWLFNELKILCCHYKDTMNVLHTPKYCIPIVVENFLHHFLQRKDRVIVHNICSIYY